MKVKFSEKEFNFFKCTLFEEENRFKLIIIDNTAVELNDELVDAIRDWAGEKQQIIGFNEDYELTKEGEILQSIIDKLYH